MRRMRRGMKVTFKHWGAKSASGRYRAIIPSRELMSMGVERGNDWLVIGKHGWDWERETAGFGRVCFDVCDDHFDDHAGDHYRLGIDLADMVTCNSLEMCRIIKAKTGRDSVCIPDPYEQPEREPRVHDHVLWFGHESNLGDLLPWADRFAMLEVVTGGGRPGVTWWSPRAMDEAFDRAGVVIIPTGKSMAKSGNRAIEAIRRGLFVVAGYLPAYADLGVYIGDIGDGVEWALGHREEAMQRIKTSQDYVRDEYSPKRIAGLWKQALLV